MAARSVDRGKGTFSVVFRLGADQRPLEVEWLAAPVRRAAIYEEVTERRQLLGEPEVIAVSGTFDPEGDRPAVVLHAYARGAVEAEAHVPVYLGTAAA